MALWEFDQTKASSVRMEVTQADQFNNDEVSLAEALIRESIQNSSDAAIGAAPVKVRFAINEVEGARALWLLKTLGALRPHYEACGFDASAANATKFRVLAIEDFNTKGLTGNPEDIDKGNFDRFWRAVGDSGKKGKAGGRWGLGKLVYSSASALKLFYGLTVTAENPRPALMGQVVLENHRIGDAFHPAHGFYFEGRSKRFDLQQPIYGEEEISVFRSFGGLKRKDETGLSLIIPYLLEGINETSIISSVINNYYFPILAKRLIVEVGDIVIDNTTFASVAAKYDASHHTPFDFVTQISDSLNTPPSLTARLTLGKEELNARFFSLDEITGMKEKFARGEMVRVRVPVTLKPKDRPDTVSHIDLYLRSLPQGAKPYALIARNAITLPGERRYFGNGAAYAALIANEEEISGFLGDAENPAHTAWNTKAKKLASGWRSPAETLATIRHSLRQLFALVAEQAESEDAEALIDFFSILEQNQGRKGKRVTKPKPKIPPRENAISIRPRKGGFDIVAGPAAVKWAYPRAIRVRVAYDMIGANPFKRHSPYDFDLSKKQIEVDAINASYTAITPNILKVIAEKPDFRLEFSGFDERRDIVVDARAQ
jgi:hypothetical protein